MKIRPPQTSQLVNVASLEAHLVSGLAAVQQTDTHVNVPGCFLFHSWCWYLGLSSRRWRHQQAHRQKRTAEEEEECRLAAACPLGPDSTLESFWKEHFYDCYKLSCRQTWVTLQNDANNEIALRKIDI